MENTGTPGISSPIGLASGKFTRSCTFASTHPNSILRESGGWPGVIRRRGVSRSRYRSVNPCRLLLGFLAIGSALAQHHDFRDVVRKRGERKGKRKDDDTHEYFTKNMLLRASGQSKNIRNNKQILAIRNKRKEEGRIFLLPYF